MGRNQHRPYGAREDKALRRWHRAGVKLLVMARRLGRPASGVGSRCRRLGLRRRERHRRATSAKVRRCWERGLSDNAAAARLGLCRGVVAYWRGKLNLPPVGKPGRRKGVG